MAEDRKGLKIKEDGLGEVQIAEEVITNTFGQVLHSKTAYQLFCDISTHRAYTLYLSGSKTCDDRDDRA